MFQLEWTNRSLWEAEGNPVPAQKSKLSRADVRRTSLLHWEDHCLECAAPLCFSSCSLYARRADRRCSRFAYGIYPNPELVGLFDFGADVRFRRWGKLEALYYGKSIGVGNHRLLDRVNRLLVQPGARASSSPPSEWSRRARERATTFWKVNLAKVRNKYLVRVAPNGGEVTYDAFVLECFSPDPEGFRLVLEYSVGKMNPHPHHNFVGKLERRHSFDISPGWNYCTLPATLFMGNAHVAKIALYPENNAERRLIFTWLDFIQFADGRQPETQPSTTEKPLPVAKVKCVAWDLDNTLWQGILAEDTETKLTVRPEALELIKKLDDRGIVQTVVSKNNYADAWPVIERLGLKDYFLYPAINWRPKSANLREVASRLNLSLDSFALIDDSAFERAEVQSALPQARVYSDEQICQLLTFAEFDVQVSETSKQRRLSYLTEIKREQEMQEFGNDYEAFLRSCNMQLKLFIPQEEQHIRRCLELIQRSNQLNLSSTRYTEEQFRGLLSHPDTLCVAMDCKDRFGSYGIIGFVSVDEGGQSPIVRDLVLSCRVAQKRVEHTFMGWLATREVARGKNVLLAQLVKTDRNGPIRQVFEDLRFEIVREEGGHCLMQRSLRDKIEHGNIVSVETEPALQTSDLAMADWQATA